MSDVVIGPGFAWALAGYLVGAALTPVIRAHVPWLWPPRRRAPPSPSPSPDRPALGSDTFQPYPGVLIPVLVDVGCDPAQVVVQVRREGMPDWVVLWFGTSRVVPGGPGLVMQQGIQCESASGFLALLATAPSWAVSGIVVRAHGEWRPHHLRLAFEQADGTPAFVAAEGELQWELYT